MRFHAVVEDFDAVAVHAANHRSAGVWPKVTAADPRQMAQCFTQCALLLLPQIIALQHLHSLYALCITQWITRHGDFIEPRRFG